MGMISDLRASNMPDLDMSIFGLENKEQDQLFTSQMQTIAIFYFVSVWLQTLLYLLGYDAIENGEILCASKQFLIIHSEMGGLYMLFYTICLFGYSIIMWYVFYRLPFKNNMVAFTKMG